MSEPSWRLRGYDFSTFGSRRMGATGANMMAVRPRTEMMMSMLVSVGTLLSVGCAA